MISQNVKFEKKNKMFSVFQKYIGISHVRK